MLGKLPKAAALPCPDSEVSASKLRTRSAALCGIIISNWMYSWGELQLGIFMTVNYGGGAQS